MLSRLIGPFVLAVALSVPVGAVQAQTAGAVEVPDVLPPMPPAGLATGGGSSPLLSEGEQEALLREELEAREPSLVIVETVPPGPAGEATGGGELLVEPGEQQALLDEREVTVPAAERVREPAELFRGPPGEATGGADIPPWTQR